MITPRLILLILALLAFGLAAAGVPSRFNLVAAGLFLWMLTLILAI